MNILIVRPWHVKFISRVSKTVWGGQCLNEMDFFWIASFSKKTPLVQIFPAAEVTYVYLGQEHMFKPGSAERCMQKQITSVIWLDLGKFSKYDFVLYLILGTQMQDNIYFLNGFSPGTGLHSWDKASGTWWTARTAGRRSLWRWLVILIYHLPLGPPCLVIIAIQITILSPGLNVQLVDWTKRETEFYAYNKSLVVDFKGKPVKQLRSQVNWGSRSWLAWELYSLINAGFWLLYLNWLYLLSLVLNWPLLLVLSSFLTTFEPWCMLLQCMVNKASPTGLLVRADLR